jgi:chloramphenicol-sensitive protein RarD
LGFAAYLLAGINRASAYEILAHRAIWSLFACYLFLTFQKQLKETFALIKNLRAFSLLALTSLLLSINWGIYIWAVSVDRVVEAALGYYITPLVAVTFGVFVLKSTCEVAIFSVALATIGVVVLDCCIWQHYH